MNSSRPPPAPCPLTLESPPLYVSMTAPVDAETWETARDVLEAFDNACYLIELIDEPWLYRSVTDDEQR